MMTGPFIPYRVMTWWSRLCARASSPAFGVHEQMRPAVRCDASQLGDDALS